MIDVFHYVAFNSNLCSIYHTYSFDNENTIKMNDSMMDIFHYVAFNSNLCSNETNF